MVKEKKSSGLARLGLIPAVVGGNLLTPLFESKKVKDARKREIALFGSVQSDYLKTSKKTTTKELSSTTAGKVLGIGTLGAGLALGVATGQAGKIVSALSPKQKGLALLGAGLISTSSIVRKAVINAPSTLVDAGIKAGEKIQQLPEDKTKDKGLLGLGLALLTGAGVGAGVSNLLDNVPKDKTAEIPKTSTDNYLDAPIPQQYDTITTSSGKKRKRKARVKDYNRINQSVRVIVNNSSRGLTINKKYLNTMVYN